MHKGHTKFATVIQDLFEQVEFDEKDKEGPKLVKAPLPHLWLDAAQIVEALIRGYGAEENAELLFHFVWGVE